MALQREAAAVAEHIEHPPAWAVVGHGEAVFALIEIEAGLVPFAQIDAVTDPMLFDKHRPVGQLAPVAALFVRHAFHLHGAVLLCASQCRAGDVVH